MIKLVSVGLGLIGILHPEVETPGVDARFTNASVVVADIGPLFSIFDELILCDGMVIEMPVHGGPCQMVGISYPTYLDILAFGPVP